MGKHRNPLDFFAAGMFSMVTSFILAFLLGLIENFSIPLIVGGILSGGMGSVFYALIREWIER